MTAKTWDGLQGLEAVITRRRKRVLAVGFVLAAFGVAVAVVSLGAGAVPIPAADVVSALTHAARGDADPTVGRNALVVVSIRLPRLLMGFLVGAGLAVAGALMQGLFRNPLADPGLVGVSAGAALAAAATIVLGDAYLAPIVGQVPFGALPFGAFVGGLLATVALYAVATRQGRTSISTMLLAGVALGGLAGALTGLLAFTSDDRQLRDLTFWSLGSLGGSTWTKVVVTAPIIVALVLSLPLLAKGLNSLALGEAEAFHLGVPVQRLKTAVVILTALAVGASVAAAGVIGFIGIVVPHLIRIVLGPDHRILLPFSALLGGTLLMGADVIARTVVAPAELPIGIVTAAVGAPFFLWLLLRRRGALA